MQAESSASQGYVVSMKATFTSQASLLCAPGATAGPSELGDLWAIRFPLAPEGTLYLCFLVLTLLSRYVSDLPPFYNCLL
jgi:hypothetical protein